MNRGSHAHTHAGQGTTPSHLAGQSPAPPSLDHHRRHRRADAPGGHRRSRGRAGQPAVARHAHAAGRGRQPDRRTMVIDVIQVFEGKAAAEAAIQDGLSPADPEWMFLYIRNQNPRLRTLPIARDASIKLLGTCEGPAPRAMLNVLARNAATNGYYYSLTITDGSVRRIVEHQRQPAC